MIQKHSIDSDDQMHSSGTTKDRFTYNSGNIAIVRLSSRLHDRRKDELVVCLNGFWFSPFPDRQYSNKLYRNYLPFPFTYPRLLTFIPNQSNFPNKLPFYSVTRLSRWSFGWKHTTSEQDA